MSPIQRTWPEGLVVWLDFLRGVAALAVLALAAGLPVWRAIGHDARRLAREGAIALVVGWSLQVFFLVPWRLPLGPLWKFLAGRSFSVYAFHVPFILLGAMLAGGAVRFFGLGWPGLARGCRGPGYLRTRHPRLLVLDQIPFARAAPGDDIVARTEAARMTGPVRHPSSPARAAFGPAP